MSSLRRRASCDHAREIDLAQLDRRTRERAHHRGGILRIDEQARPSEHIAHLGPLAESRQLPRPVPLPTESPGGVAGAILETGTTVGYERTPRGGTCLGRRADALRSGMAVDAIDWGAAQRIGELIAGAPPSRRRARASRSSHAHATSPYA